MTSTPSRRYILKNILLISFCFVLTFTALSGIVNLQSSLNSDQGLGTTTLAIVYVFLVLSCLLFPSLFISKFGCKRTILISLFGYIVYNLTNLYPSWYTLIPGSILLGLSAAPLWSAQCTYFTQMGRDLAKITMVEEQIVITRFFGIFFGFFQTSGIWGNLASSLIFKKVQPQNSTNFGFDDKCGINFCPSTLNGTDFGRPSLEKIYIFLSLCIIISLLPLPIIFFLVDNIELDNDKSSANVKDKLMSTVKQTIRPMQLLLIPITIYSGVEQAFQTGDFTQAFVGCNLGIPMIGFVMIAYSTADTIASLLIGKVIERVNRIFIMTFGFVVHIVCMMVYIFWVPIPQWPPFIFIVAAMWGVGDAVWQTVINAIYGSIFTTNSEAAFSNYRLWESLGFALAFSYGAYLCVRIKIYINIAFLGVGMIGYLTVEYLIRKRNTQSKCPNEHSNDKDTRV